VTTALTLGQSAMVDRTELALTVDLLGPLTLRVEGRVVEVPGFQRRALLALLALAGDRGLTTERVVDSLWPDDPPENAVHALYNHVSRLRGHLGPAADRLEKLARGYRLRLEPYELDVDAVHRLKADDPRAALDLWRGPALAELHSVPWLETESVGLDELRLQLVDEVLEARLMRGESVIVEAAAAAAESPFRERTALLHIRAFAADGRSAEAMAAAQGFRTRLVEETGLDPTPALADLEHQVASGLLAASPRPRVTRPDGPMVGRQHDREEVVRLLGSQAVVTLTGPGGVGKTRLALDIAADAAEAVVVPFAVVVRPERVCEAVASTLGLRITGEVRPTDIAAALADRELLLVLDNCEHLTVACRDLVAAVRRSAPGVRVLSTSRETLQVSGEYVVRLQPLPVPRDVSDLDALRRQAGVRAFVEHARRRILATRYRPTKQRISLRSCTSSTACRWASNWPRGRRRWRRYTPSASGSTARSTWRPDVRVPRASDNGRSGRPSARHTSCSRLTSNDCSAPSRRLPAVSTWPLSRTWLTSVSLSTWCTGWSTRP
jgi:DNA-binding SARP family transcriptional activator